MTRFRIVLVVALVAVIGWSLLRHGQTWKTYHGTGWSISMPASFHAVKLPGGSVVLTKSRTEKPFVFSVRPAGVADGPDTRLPLDPVDFHLAARGVDGSEHRAMPVVSHSQLYRVDADYKPADESKVFRMLRSLRFDG